MKKLFCIALACSVLVTSVFAKSKVTYETFVAVEDFNTVKMKDISATEVTKLMGTGWNLGNTFDATGSRTIDSETSWGQPLTTKKMIEGLAKSGIKTIRIPTSWSNHLIDSNYTIDPAWMERVKEVVDWAIESDMYVILNIHHDNCLQPNTLAPGKGYYPTEKDYKISEDFVVNVWAQIALAFNNGYDEHLIFETLNEPRLAGTNLEWNFNASNPQSKEAAEVINRLNQAALDTIRESKGNNAKRFVMVPGYVASPESVLNDSFRLPADSASKKLLVSVHMYTPYHFAMQSPGSKLYSPAIGNELAWSFKKLNTKFVSNGIGVVIGEYGATNKNNTEERVKWFSAYIKQSRAQNLVAVLWDNGAWKIKEGSNDFNEKFGYYNRKAGTWYFPEIIKAIQEAL